MQNKTNRWLDVQIVVVSLAMTFSLALWNLFAGGDRKLASTVNTIRNKPSSLAAASSSSTVPVVEALTIVPATPVPPQGPIYLGGAAPGSSSSVASNPSGDSGSSSSNSIPAPVTSTRSSRP